MNKLANDTTRNSKKQKFTKEEDEELKKIVSTYGAKRWNKIASHLKNRTGRQCRDRYMNYLAPNIKKASFSFEEDLLLMHKIEEFGTHWSKIKTFFPGRTSSSLKNRFYVTLNSAKHWNQSKLYQKMTLKYFSQSPPMNNMNNMLMLQNQMLLQNQLNMHNFPTQAINCNIINKNITENHDNQNKTIEPVNTDKETMNNEEATKTINVVTKNPDPTLELFPFDQDENFW